MARGRKPPSSVTRKPRSGRVQPTWVPYFLRALERTGQARAAAADAGVDFSTAYARRRAHADFADEWAEALRRFRAARDEAREAELAETVERVRKKAPPPHFVRSPSPANSGEDEIVIRPSAAGAPKLVKASAGRWSRKREEAFLAELAASNNIRRACLAAGLSRNALHARRRKDPHFAAAWDAVVEIGKVEVRSFLAEATARTFDPESLPDPDSSPLPKVTVAEAIRIAELKGPPAANAEPASAPAAPAGLASDAEVRAALAKGLAAFGGRVARRDDAWEELKFSGADPHRLGPLGQAVLSAERPAAESTTRSCPHCRHRLFVSFARDAGSEASGGNAG